MKKSVLFILAIFFLPAFINVENIDPERQWSQFRGYMSSGVLDQANLPNSWDVDKNENVLWNKDIPGPVKKPDRTDQLPLQRNPGFQIHLSPGPVRIEK